MTIGDVSQFKTHLCSSSYSTSQQFLLKCKVWQRNVCYYVVMCPPHPRKFYSFFLLHFCLCSLCYYVFLQLSCSTTLIVLLMLIKYDVVIITSLFLFFVMLLQNLLYMFDLPPFFKQLSSISAQLQPIGRLVTFLFVSINTYLYVMHVYSCKTWPLSYAKFNNVISIFQW